MTASTARIASQNASGSAPCLTIGPCTANFRQTEPLRNFNNRGKERVMPKSTMALLNLLFWSLSLFATALGSSPAAPQASEDHRSGSLEQIMPGHYAYYSRNRVSGVIVTSEGVVVIDALSSEAMAQHEREVISSVIKQPVRFLVSSSFHNNYTRGNVAYQDAIRIGHENYRADLLELMKEVSVAERKARLPHQTYRDRMTLRLGGKEIQILHFGRAHTRGDSIVFVPEDRIVYLSELFFYERFPWMNTGYGIDWLQALDIALALEADILCRHMEECPMTPGNLDKRSFAFGRSWWMCATPFRKRLREGQRKIRLLPRSHSHSTETCLDTNSKGKLS